MEMPIFVELHNYDGKNVIVDVWSHDFDPAIYNATERKHLCKFTRSIVVADDAIIPERVTITVEFYHEIFPAGSVEQLLEYYYSSPTFAGKYADEAMLESLVSAPQLQEINRIIGIAINNFIENCIVPTPEATNGND